MGRPSIALGASLSLLCRTIWREFFSKVFSNFRGLTEAINSKMDSVHIQVETVQITVDLVDSKVDLEQTTVDSVDTRVDSIHAKVESLDKGVKGKCVRSFQVVNCRTKGYTREQGRA